MTVQDENAANRELEERERLKSTDRQTVQAMIHTAVAAKMQQQSKYGFVYGLLDNWNRVDKR